MIDVGINRTDAGLVGDVAYAAAAERARADHARPRRRRPDDDRDAAAQHAAGGEGAGGMRRVRAGEVVAGVGGRAAARLAVPGLVHGVAAATDGPRRAWSRVRASSTCSSRSSRCSGSRSRVSQVVGRGPALPVALGVITTTLALAGDAARALPDPQPARPERGDRRRAPAPGSASPPASACSSAPGCRSATSARGPRTRCRRCPSAARPRRAPKIRRMSLSRDQVLHVARLARLELTEDEVGRFSEELSKVFDWVETIERARRPRGRRADLARRRRRERAARRRAARPRCRRPTRWPAAPDPAQGGFRVPSPGAGGGA